MTAITIDVDDVSAVKRGDLNQLTLPAGEVITAGQYIRQDPATGKFALGKATTEAEIGDGYFAEHSAAIGMSVTGLKDPCVVDVGAALDALDYGDPVYLSDTDGTFADAAGTVPFIAGTVIPAWPGSAKRLLRLDFKYDLVSRVVALEGA